MGNEPDYTIKSIEKALSILNLFTPDHPQLSLKEIKDFLQMPKPTAFRVLYTLKRLGLLRKDPKTGNYRLGLKLIYYGNIISLDYDIIRIARPVMEELRDKTRETVDCTILDHNQVLYIELLHSTQRIKAETSQVGRRMPLHCTACGKVLAAFSKDELNNTWPPDELPGFTRNTITDHNKLEKELEKVRKLGYATDKEELDEGIYAVSAPIYDLNNTILAALTIVAPATRVDKKTFSELTQQVISSAKKISDSFQTYV